MVVSLRRAIALPGLLALLAALPFAGARAADPADRLYRDEVRYLADGQDYFRALTKLLVAEAEGRVDVQAPSTRELAARARFAYGLQRQAEATLERMTDRAAAALLRQTALLDAAEAAWRRGDAGAARQSLSAIQRPADADIARRSQLLLARLALDEQDYGAAVRVLQPLAGGPDAAGSDPVASYNLAVAYLRRGDWQRAGPILARLSEASEGDEVGRTLHDLARFTLGQGLLQQNRSQEALQQFESIRLHGALGTRALLASGRVLELAGDSDRALVVWKVLRQRSVFDPIVQEAWLRIGDSLYQGGKYQDAAFAFDEAIATFEQAGRSLVDSRAAIERGRFFAALRELDATAPDWPSQLVVKVPEARVLGAVLASERYAEAFAMHRQVNQLRHNLERWQAHLQRFDQLVTARAELARKRAPWVEEKVAAMDPAPLRQQLQALQRDYEAATAGAAGLVLESPAEARWLDHLQRLESHLSGLPEGEAAPLRQRIALLRARLTWLREAAFAQRLRDSRAALAELAVLLGEAERRSARLSAAQATTARDLAARRGRLQALQGRLQDLLSQVEAALGEQERVLGGVLIASLDHLQQRLDRGTIEARVRLVRNYDAAMAGAGAAQ